MNKVREIAEREWGIKAPIRFYKNVNLYLPIRLNEPLPDNIRGMMDAQFTSTGEDMSRDNREPRLAESVRRKGHGFAPDTEMPRVSATKRLREWADTDPKKWWPRESDDFLSGYRAAQIVARSILDKKGSDRA